MPIEFTLEKLGEISVAGILVAVCAISRFNKWTEKDAPNFQAPPRSYTTWWRFSRSQLAYISIMELIYLGMVFFPMVLYFVMSIIKKELADNPEKFIQHSHLWALVIMIGILPSFPKIKAIEQSIRRKIHRKALIPDSAKKIIAQLKNYPQTFKPKKAYASKVFAHSEICSGSDSALFTPDNNIFYNIFKIEYVLQRLEDWRGVEAIESALACHKERIKKVHKTMRGLKTNIESLKNLLELGKGTNQECIAMLEEKIKKTVNEMQSILYEVICGTILLTKKFHKDRRSAFEFFALYPKMGRGLPYDWNTLILTATTIFGSLFFPSLLYFLLLSGVTTNNDLIPQSTTEAFWWAFIGLFMHGSCIYIAVVAKRYASRGHQISDPFSDDPESKAGLSLPLCVVAGTMGYLFSFFCMALLAKLTLGKPIIQGIAEGAWLWPFIAAATSVFTVYHLEVSVFNENSRSNLAIKQSLVTAAIGVLVGLIRLDLPLTPDKIYFLIFIGVSLLILGGGIGYVFPTGYKSRLARQGAARDRRLFERKSTNDEAVIYSRSNMFPCKILDISDSGVKVDCRNGEKIGENINIELPEIGKVLCHIVRQGPDGTACQIVENAA